VLKPTVKDAVEVGLLISHNQIIKHNNSTSAQKQNTHNAGGGEAQHRSGPTNNGGIKGKARTVCATVDQLI
jgi:hypothetical protein